MNDYTDGVFVSPYDCTDPKNEPRPDLAAYQPCFEELKLLILAVIELLRKPLKQSAYQNVITKGLLQEVDHRTKESSFHEYMFAVVGAMASGKSSLLNSIMGIGMIARKGDGGGSCTWTNQRFLRMFPDQNSTFAAQVHFFSPDEVRAILKSLIARYYRVKRKSRNNEDDIEIQDENDDDYSERVTVLETLMPLFCEVPEFQSAPAAMEFLDEIQSEDDKYMLEDLVSRAGMVLGDHLAEDDVVKISGSTTDELIRNLQPYTYTNERDLGLGITQPWPLVSMVDFGLDIPILNNGTCLVDSSGTSDANSCRAANARAQQSKCSHKIYVVEARRAKDDKQLRELLASAYRKGGCQDALLVITHADHIGKSTRVEGSPIAVAAVQKLEASIAELGRKISQIGIKRPRSTAVEQVEMEGEINDLFTEREQLKKQLDVARLRMRNDDIKAYIQKQYKELSGDPRPLPIFMVGNETYDIYQAGYYAHEKPNLSVEETGVPDLRRHIYSMPAEGKLNDILHLAFHQLPSLINSFDIYCSRMHLARKSELEALILQPKQELPSILRTAYKRFLAVKQSRVLDPMKTKEDAWIDKARKLCQKWAKEYKTKHLALLKRDGFQLMRGKNKQEINWNLELVQINKRFMEQCFRGFRDAVAPHFDSIGTDIQEQITKVTTSLRKDQQFNLMALEKLVKSITAEKGNIYKCIDKARKDMKQGLSVISDATLSKPQDGYLSAAMAEIYANIREIKGSGAPNKRLAEFERSVCRMTGVWYDIHNSLDDAFGQLFQNTLVDLKDAVEPIFDAMRLKFDMMCADTVAKSEEEKRHEEELIERLTKATIEAEELVDGPIATLALECKNYSAVKEDDSLFVSKG